MRSLFLVIKPIIWGGTLLGLVFFSLNMAKAQNQRPREIGIKIGILPTGPLNAITDVSGVQVGHHTLIDEGKSIRTGVTAILPHDGNVFQQKVPAAIYIGNGFGKLMGYSQVKELGNLESPVVLTNTLSVPAAAQGLIEYILGQESNEDVRSVNPVVGETNDGYLNDIRGMHVKPEHVWQAIKKAESGPVVEGSVGAGSGPSALVSRGALEQLHGSSLKNWEATQWVCWYKATSVGCYKLMGCLLEKSWVSTT